MFTTHACIAGWFTPLFHRVRRIARDIAPPRPSSRSPPQRAAAVAPSPPHWTPLHHRHETAAPPQSLSRDCWFPSRWPPFARKRQSPALRARSRPLPRLRAVRPAPPHHLPHALYPTPCLRLWVLPHCRHQRRGSQTGVDPASSPPAAATPGHDGEPAAGSTGIDASSATPP
ncbi:hypothetical protein PVAP13_6NG287200 [Panicum virgatum]|uniref:Uncharacterized protein n=1 Tax=Panicum virgatum TaxID=38727 RepID=A0A8T0R1E1_PANVG|nr:hypothetical protein PVAP13_6NG287200 [Panicum virgatum]